MKTLWDLELTAFMAVASTTLAEAAFLTKAAASCAVRTFVLTAPTTVDGPPALALRSQVHALSKTTHTSCVLGIVSPLKPLAAAFRWQWLVRIAARGMPSFGQPTQSSWASWRHHSLTAQVCCNTLLSAKVLVSSGESGQGRGKPSVIKRTLGVNQGPVG